MSAILVAVDGPQAGDWLTALRLHAKGRAILAWPDPAVVAGDIGYACVWLPPRGLLARFPRLRAILNLGAGVDHLLADPTLPPVPIARVIHADLSTRVVEYVVLHVLMHHRRQRLYDAQQQQRLWRAHNQPVASEVAVGVMGLGAIGGEVALALSRLGFRVAGFSRTAKSIAGVECFHGDAGLDAFLQRTEILVCLLPSTPDTDGILNLALLRKLKRDGAAGGAVLINAGRGHLQIDADIVAALDEGALTGATLDVFPEEPLPRQSPLWTPPKVTVTSAAYLSTIRSTATAAIDRLTPTIPIVAPRGGIVMAGLVGRAALIVMALLALVLPRASAQDYPSRAITIVVPLAPGTGMDIIARLYGDQLSQRLGKPVIIENKPGAAFLIATQQVLAAPPDGHTLLVAAPSNLAYNQTLYKQLPYDPEKDLVPISHYLTSPFILVVNPALPVHTAPEFIKYAKEQSTPLSYSTPAGIGVPGFAVEEMARRFGLKFNHVPYRNSPQSILDVATGQIQFAFAEAGASQALIRDGKLRALAVSSHQRLPAHPSIPPFSEAANAPGYEVVAWHMLVARSNTPKPILERLNAEMKQIMAAPAMQKRMSDMGLIPIDPPPLAETDRYIKSEIVKFRELITAIGLAGTQ